MLHKLFCACTSVCRSSSGAAFVHLVTVGQVVVACRSGLDTRKGPPARDPTALDNEELFLNFVFFGRGAAVAKYLRCDQLQPPGTKPKLVQKVGWRRPEGRVCFLVSGTLKWLASP
eukprot:4952302-Amphidinium_carterae.1